ncbi:MAG: hypothetical protein JSU08_09345 [Acidobacteria bacterium]|nr:hypothetical protein [Acidobacteriota bacterium]
MFRSGHLKDDQLLECYYAGRTGEALDPRLADHLSTCMECNEQFDTITTFLDDIRTDAEEEADALFTAEHLRTQREHILDRLDQVQRPARVISFPRRDATPAQRSGGRVPPRWLAAAAAAGLFIGVAVGGYFGPERLLRAPGGSSPSRQMVVQPRPSPKPAVLVNSTQPTASDDDAFLMDLELALARPQPRELQAFDAMTPHVRDLR